MDFISLFSLLFLVCIFFKVPFYIYAFFIQQHNNYRINIQHCTNKKFSPSSLLCLRVSSSINDNDLAKLHEKRKALRRVKLITSSLHSKNHDEKIKDALSVYQGNMNLTNFEEMPLLQTTRPKRESYKMRIHVDVVDKKQSGYKYPYFDALADYADENNLHVPNRIGFCIMEGTNKASGFIPSKGPNMKCGYKNNSYNFNEFSKIYNELIFNGIRFLDTSECHIISGHKMKLPSENIFGRIIKENKNNDIPIISCTMNSPWMSLCQGRFWKDIVQLGRNGVLNTIDYSCEALGIDCIDLYQIPSSSCLFYSRTVINDLCEALNQSRIKNIGVTNMNKNSMTRFASKLEKKRNFLTSNTFGFSLINRNAWKSGLIKECKNLGVIPIAHSPLGGGLASGLYTYTNPTGYGSNRMENQRYNLKTLEKYNTLHTMLQTIQKKVSMRLEKKTHDDLKKSKHRSMMNRSFLNMNVTTAQIAINYVVGKGCVPIPEINNMHDVDQLIGCLGWSLTSEEINMLDDAADMSDDGIII